MNTFTLLEEKVDPSIKIFVQLKDDVSKFSGMGDIKSICLVNIPHRTNGWERTHIYNKSPFIEWLVAFNPVRDFSYDEFMSKYFDRMISN